jgi:hypothetical protein
MVEYVPESLRGDKELFDFFNALFPGQGKRAELALSAIMLYISGILHIVVRFLTLAFHNCCMLIAQEVLQCKFDCSMLIATVLAGIYMYKSPKNLYSLF